MIYSFATTPLLSGLTALLHAGILIRFWQLDRQGWFEAPGFATVVDQEQFLQLQEATTLSPDDPQLQISYIDALRQGGAENKAKYLLKKFLKDHPDSAIGYLESAAINSAGKSQVPKKAALDAEKALSFGLSNRKQNAFAHELIGKHQLEIGKTEEAINNFSQAIALLSIDSQDQYGNALANLLVLRSRAFRRQKLYEQSYQDIQQVISYALESDDKGRLAQAQQDLETLEKHIGHSFGSNHLLDMGENHTLIKK